MRDAYQTITENPLEAKLVSRHLLTWAFTEKNCPPNVEDINFFRVDPPWISIQIYCDPPGILFFYSIFGLPPGIPKTLLYLEFSIDILIRGVTIFFWKRPLNNCHFNNLYYNQVNARLNFVAVFFYQMYRNQILSWT